MHGRLPSTFAALCLLAPLALAREGAAPPPAPAAAARDPAAPAIGRAALVRHVEVLASEDFEGRGAGTPGGKLAATYMVRLFKEAGLAPRGTRRYLQPFQARNRSLTNVVGLLEGADPALAQEYVLIGAHFDHLGRNGDTIWFGADDNASGCAVLIEVARAFQAAGAPRRSVLFVSFDSEERGLAGSKHFVAEPVVPLDRIVAMVNLDMVSRGETEELRVVGTPYSPLLKEIVEAAAPAAELELFYDHEQDWRHASDHGPFGDAGIPFLYFGVLDHEDYHKPTDTADKINAEKLERIARLAFLTVRGIADAPERPTYGESR